MIEEKTKLKATNSTSRGCECYYFSQNNGTGWKVYQSKSIALLAWATQKWAYEQGFAPKILSNIFPVMFQPNKPNGLYCPLKVRLCLFDNQYKYYNEDTGKYCIAPCSEFFIKNEPKFTVIYGFITEEVDYIASAYPIFEEIEEAKCELRNEIEKLLKAGCTGDFHRENWGMLKNKALFIDFGTHFTNNILDWVKKEINSFMDKADKNIYTEGEIKSTYLN